MHRGFLALALALLCSGAVVAAATPPAVTPAKTQTFKDWIVGCDNGLSCQAVALAPDGSSEDTLSLLVRRSGGEGEFSVELSGFPTSMTTYRISIDNRAANRGAVATGTDAFQIVGPGAMKLARAMAKGLTLRLNDGSGVAIGRVSLLGATAAMRYMDRAQGRVGSRSAIVATGRRAATATRDTQIPVILTSRIKPSDMLPDTAALVALSENSPCANERVGATQDSTFSLGDTKALVLLNCGARAYNASVAAYIGGRDETGKWTFNPATFDYAPSRLTEADNIALLVNATWDSATQTLSGFYKGRVIGDCGSADDYVWDGTSFRLVKARVMDQCRGSTEWIPVWRAEVKLIG